MKIRKQVYQLTLDDLESFPIWEFALDEEDEAGQDEATVRPYPISGALDPSDGMFIVRANFVLADGTLMHGYLTPSVHDGDYLGTSQPIIVTQHGQVSFWNGLRAPSAEKLAKKYQWLGKDSAGVFPIEVTSHVELTCGPIHTVLPGFIVLEDFKTRKIRIVK